MEDIHAVAPPQEPVSPSAGPRGAEVAKSLKEDAPTGPSKMRRHSHSKGRNRLKWHRTPSPQCLSRCQSPSPSPPQSHLAVKQLSHSMKDLNLYARSCKSRIRVQQNDVGTLAEKPKKQVRFNMDGDLGNDPTLPPGLTIFLAEGLAEE